MGKLKPDSITLERHLLDVIEQEREAARERAITRLQIADPPMSMRMAVRKNDEALKRFLAQRRQKRHATYSPQLYSRPATPRPTYRDSVGSHPLIAAVKRLFRLR